MRQWDLDAPNKGELGGLESMKPGSRTLIYRICLGCTAALLGSCGGGGGGPPPATLSLSANKVSFKAVGPFAVAPPTQTLTGTVTNLTTSGTLYITVTANNPNGLFTVSNVAITGNSGQLQVIPAAAPSLGAGSFQGSITVSACLNDSTCRTGQLAGSPQTIPVEYDIGSGVDGDTVTPHVAAANTPGTAVLRGTGFTGATSVNFGSTAASSITVVSNSEIDASYPALPAGTYPVTVNGGSMSDTASLVVVSPPGFTQTLITYPSDLAGQRPMELVYDAQRTAVFVLFQSGNTITTPLSSTLLRYAFDGGVWGTPTRITMANLEQVHLSPDGAHLLALVPPSAGPDGQPVAMAELDPVTMAQTNISTTLSPSGANNVPCGFALANDGNAMITFPIGIGVNGLAFGTFSHEFTVLAGGPNPVRDNGQGCYPLASGNGAVVQLGGLMNGNVFLASTEMVTDSGAPTPALESSDLAGDKFLISGLRVDSQAGQLIGDLPSGYGIINSAGTRAYQYQVNAFTCAAAVVTFDLTGTPDPNAPEYPVLGSPIAVPNDCTNAAFDLLAITPDEGTIFVARTDGVFVQPL